MATYTYGPGDLATIKTKLAEGGHTIYLRQGKYVIQNSGGRGWTVAGNTKLIGMGSSTNEQLSGSVGAVLVMGTTRSYPDNSGMIYMYNADNVLFENLSFTGYNVNSGSFGSSTNVIMYGDYCDNLEVRKCFFAYSEIDFIKLRHSTGVKVHHNRMWFPGHECLYVLGGCNTVDFSYNDCRTRTNSACRISYANSNIKIHHNNISGKAPSSYTFYDGNVGGTFTTATKLSGGYSHPGLELDTQGDNYEIYQNYISDITGCGIWIFSKTTVKVNNLKIHHNTFTNTGLGGCNYCNAAIHIYQADDVLIYNNRFVGSSGYGRSLHCYRGYNVKTDSEGRTYNNYFGDPKADTYNISFTNNTGALARDIEIVNTLSSSTSKHTIVSSGNTIGAGNGVTEATGWTAGDSGTTPPSPTPPTTVYPYASITGTPTTFMSPGSTFRMDWTTLNCTSAVIEKTLNHVVIETTPLVLGNGTGANSGTISKVLTSSAGFTIRGYNNTVNPVATISAACMALVSQPTVPAPTGTFTVSKSPITTGETVVFTVTGATNTSTAKITLSYNGTSSFVDLIVSLNSSGTGSITSAAFTGTGTRTCILTLIGPTGLSTKYTIQLTVNPVAAPVTPTLTFTSNYTTVDADSDIRLSWTTTNATSFIITPGGEQTSIASGFLDVKMAETTTFIAQAFNGTVSATKSITITVNPPPPPAAPSISLHTTADTIDIDKSAIISWYVTMADTFECDHGIGSLDNISGSIEVFPTTTTTYEFVADGAGGATIRTLTITVESGDIQSLFVASPATICLGDSATLGWLNRFGKTTTLSEGIGAVPSGSEAYGAYVVTPSVTTEYALTVSGSMGVDVKTFTVNVVDPVPSGSPWAHILIDNPIVNLGNPATFTWTTDGATAMACGQDIGFVNLPSGSLEVFPTMSRTYQFVVADEDDATAHDLEVYVAQDYEFIQPAAPEYEQSYIDMSARRIYISGGQSTSDTNYTWDIDTNASMRPNPDNAMITFAYQNEGYYMITLTSIDRDGEVLKQTIRANVIHI